ncbi:MAG: hypothetical protein A2289_16780 [Deltaproteobacteria bacterium RIFOXYA12_FULL_58_15]|nr:MAG: hypothetical protein A2289_16780 [Deltaproteobacteria bacterium RIFOXYA12_FULL_58_15]OGR13899.1 MAG: hypothetical protein A2341_26780 [Deltaproteobacteria bacterium RIFOXYB12_FULL_58_9]
MPQEYSSYEAKSKFAEIIRKVRAGQRVVISYRGVRVAELRPYQEEEPSLEARLKNLEAEGLIEARKNVGPPFGPVTKNPGALDRFWESRE